MVKLRYFLDYIYSNLVVAVATTRKVIYWDTSNMGNNELISNDKLKNLA
ncbi:hypothetical protein SAMN05660909_00420 [Chitinophaga terrae (ex Kim and Jung 2007)]|uniref:Uncharacterized protein n=1 Tax=Chitinophaga terrae (ex Kim and Jung 2007) TaxID=408074 RepID=A0A1H3XRG2_9BACT|nr:hypothetical protein SAMN05660909_00420 [Chitinophaga terrae (ex Kim and Jung 2007)]